MNKTIHIITLIFICYFVSSQGVFAADSKTSPLLLKKTNAPVYSVQVVNIYPHNADTFTQGLFFHEGVLYESSGLYGKSFLKKTEIESGKTLKKIGLPAKYFAEGIALHGGKIYQLTWKEKKCFVYDLINIKKTGSFSYFTQGWGITSDGKNLIMSEGSSVIYYRDPATFQIIRKINVSDGNILIDNINELEFVEGEIWANVFIEDYIARISPDTGRVLGWIDLRVLYSYLKDKSRVDVLNGIAYDKENERIFVTGKYWPYLFEITLVLNK